MADEPAKTVEVLTAENGIWGSHATWPVQDWKYEVDNDDTRLGYWEWVAQQIEMHGEADGSEE